MGLRPMLRIYIAAILVGGLALLAYVSADLAAVGWQPGSLANLGLWIAMVSRAGMSPIPLPRGGARGTVTSAVDFASSYPEAFTTISYFPSTREEKRKRPSGDLTTCIICERSNIGAASAPVIDTL